jgi:hypothetical protein
MPDSMEKVSEKKGKWLKIDVSSPSELVDALSNFLTEIGAQGVFQEEPESQAPGDFGVSENQEVLKAYLPFDIRLENRIASLLTVLPVASRAVTTAEYKPAWRGVWRIFQQGAPDFLTVLHLFFEIHQIIKTVSCGV